mmetsp:Transcript_2107/g.7296  ORF Transcript_2107/g.7296 Transcript_2107/m.7296 type:complete len:200 (+) Transcript_2107:2475-3074(+)
MKTQLPQSRMGRPRRARLRLWRLWGFLKSQTSRLPRRPGRRRRWRRRFEVCKRCGPWQVCRASASRSSAKRKTPVERRVTKRHSTMRRSTTRQSTGPSPPSPPSATRTTFRWSPPWLTFPALTSTLQLASLEGLDPRPQRRARHAPSTLPFPTTGSRPAIRRKPPTTRRGKSKSRKNGERYKARYLRTYSSAFSNPEWT